MAASRTLELIVRAKDETSKVLKNIVGTLDDFRNNFNSTIFGITQSVFSLKGALAGAGVGFFLKSFIDAAKETEGYRLQLRILTGDVERGNALFKEAADYAAKVTFEYKDIIGVVTQLRGVIRGSDQEVIKWTKLVGDVAAATGFDIRTTTEQISRMYSAGAQSAELFKERGKLAMLGFQTGVSYSVEETRKKLLESWEGPTSAIKGAAFELANTWDGLFSMIADKWFQFRAVMMEQSGIFSYLKAWVKTYIDYLDKMVTEDKMASWARSTGEIVISVFEKIATAAGYLGTAFQGWNIILGIIGKALAWVGDLLADLSDGVGDFAEFIIGLLEKFSKLQEEIANSRFTPEWLKSNMLENAIRIQGTIKGWRIELEEGNRETQLFREGMEDLRKDSVALLDSYIKQVPVHESIKKLLVQVREVAKDISEAQGAKTPGINTEEQAKMVKQSELLKNAMERMRADMDLELVMLNAQLNQKLIDLNDYYDKRREMIISRSTAEIELQRNLLSTPEVASDPNKIADIKTKIYELEKKQISEIIKMEEERREKQKTEAERLKDIAKIIEEARRRGESEDKGNLGATFDKELRELDIRHQEVIERLRKLKAAESDINDAYRAQELEKEKLLNDQRRRLNEALLDQAKTTFGQMEAMFGDLYELSGKKIKEFFYLQKAASIANTIISTMESAQKAYTSMVGIPYIGPAVAAAAAAVAVAAGMARVAVITSQALAEGGEVKGYSPNSKADNIRTRLTAGEFVQPVDSVKHYGLGVMESLRKRTIPKGLFAGIQIPDIGRARGVSGYAVGGLVDAPSRSSLEKDKPGNPSVLNINNIVDPSLMGQYLATTPGETQIINLIGNNSFAIRSILFPNG